MHEILTTFAYFIIAFVAGWGAADIAIRIKDSENGEKKG
jgi:hypothetical protein